MAKIYSMTGYALVSGQAGGARITVEAKAVNNRYLDFKLHLPRELQGLEDKVMTLARSFFCRGRIELWANLEPGERPLEVRWNRPLAEGILKAGQEMKKALGLPGEFDLSLLAGQKDVILIADSGPWGEEAWPELGAVFSECFQALQKMRAQDGEALAEDILERVRGIEKRTEEIGARSKVVVGSYRERLEKRVRELIGDQSGLDPGRLAQEVALLADHADITEELVRLRSHLVQFREGMAEEGPRGRKLDFLVQELFREINTAANKAQDAAISRFAVEIKTDLEKIREQIQNLE